MYTVYDMAVSKPQNQNGFDCEFLKKPPQEFQTECPFCLLVLREPYQVICCGKSFCHSCIERVKASNNPCTHCNEPNFNDFPNKGLQQSLYQLKVRCTHKKSGCKWTGELGVLESHLNLDPQPANKLEGCVFVMVKCTYCSKSHQRQKINNHQSKVCQKRPFTCEHCNEYKSTFEDVTTNHWLVCEYHPVPCPNKCGADIQRQKIESHVVKDCPLTEIKCDLHYVGCEVKLPRKDMGEHLRVELVTHLSMTAASYQQQIASFKQKQDEDRQTIENLVIENEALRTRVTELEGELKTNRTAIEALQVKNNFPPVDILMLNFEHNKNNNTAWYSPPFYTHHRGYKLCLKCYANSIYIKDHVSVYVYTMEGEFDDELKWPLNGQVTIQLLSHDPSKTNHKKTITIINSECHWAKGVGTRDRSKRVSGREELGFISHADLYQGYIKNDRLHFRIVEITLK